MKTTEVVQRDVPIYKEWVGQPIGALDIELRARVAGWLQGMHFAEGTDVKKGTLLYTIDQSELKQAVAEFEPAELTAPLAAALRSLFTATGLDIERHGVAGLLAAVGTASGGLGARVTALPRPLEEKAGELGRLLL